MWPTTRLGDSPDFGLCDLDALFLAAPFDPTEPVSDAARRKAWPKGLSTTWEGLSATFSLMEEMELRLLARSHGVLFVSKGGRGCVCGGGWRVCVCVCGCGDRDVWGQD